jgi:Fe-S-cluster-containing hydrogenase component 2
VEWKFVSEPMTIEQVLDSAEERVAGEGWEPQPTCLRFKRASRLVWWWVAWIAFGLLLATATAEQRFPPPDFQSGYVLPTTGSPSPRATFWQYADVGLLVLALALASWLALRRRSRRGIVALSLTSLLYFGFLRQGCICPIGSVQNVALALFDSGYAVPLTVLVFFVAPLLTALFFGRSFCAAVCPHGALQDLVLIRPVALPRWLNEALSVIPFIFLGLGLLFAATGGAFLICRFDPFVPIFRFSGSLPILLAGGAFLAAATVVGRPYCRFLCPYGALLRLASAVSQWAVRITPDRCTQCRLCEPACPFGVIRQPAADAPTRAQRQIEQRRLMAALFVLPIGIAVFGWAGSQFARAAASVQKDVALAEFFLEQRENGASTNLTSVDELALARATQEADVLLPRATTQINSMKLGGWLVGSLIGLVIGCKVLGFSLWRRRDDYEPDHAGCFSCARCFLACPQERVRLGLITPEEAAKAPPVSA